jgi:glycosyltransferase involved in cell wall biosynthesis
MGDRYPVLSVPAPVWNRSQREGSKTPVRAVVSPAEVEIEGFVFDSRGGTFRMDESPSQPPRAAAGTVAIARGRLDGVVFTAVFAPRGARENSQNMLTAFLSAFSDTPDATLVFKIVGRDSYWWWETHDLLARMPASRCRVVVLQGLLSDQQYSSLIGASHWVLNGSAAEGVCLPLLEFMSAGRPAVAPAHTAMADYLNPGNSLIVRSDEDYCTWPQDTGCRFACDCFRIEWESLRDSMREAYRITRFDPQRYDSMCDAALATMSRCCTDTLVAERIAEFLGIGAAAA